MNILLLNQCFWPDVVATAKQLTTVALRLKGRGHDVTIITGRYGYDDPKLIFHRRETWQGIEIIRLSSFNFGKKNRSARMLNFGSFLAACALRLITMPRHDVVVALTSPPLISWLGALFTRLKGGQMVFWVMDLNPDEAVAAGWLKESSFSAKFLSRLLKSSMDRAKTIVALDRFMKQRIVDKGVSETKIAVIPPTPDEQVHYDQKGRDEFRRQNSLTGKFVVMYAGNHSPCHPLNTLLKSAEELKRDVDIIFLFVGGGSELGKVKEFAHANQLANIICLPYQPQANLSATLSAADLHVVIMGDAFTGIVHPSKIYNVLSVRAPFVFIGPSESHMNDIISKVGDETIAIQARHGEPRELARKIKELATAQGRQPFARRVYSDEIINHDVLPSLVAAIESASNALPRESLIEAAARTSPGQI